MATSSTATDLLATRTNATAGHKDSTSGPKQKDPGLPISSAAASTYSSAKPDAKDILLGRGKPFQNHPGNIIMRRLLNKYKDQYNESHRDARSDIAMELIDRLLEAGARFLKRRFEGDDGGKSTTGASWIWEEASRSEAYDKVCHALRSGRKAAKKGSAQKPSVASVASSEVESGSDRSLVEEVSDDKVPADKPSNEISARHSRIAHVGMFSNEIRGLPPLTATASMGLRGSLMGGTGPLFSAVTSMRQHQLPPFSLAHAVTRTDGMRVLGISSLACRAASPHIYAPAAPRSVDPLSMLLRRHLLLNRSNSRPPAVDTDPSLTAALNAYLRG